MIEWIKEDVATGKITPEVAKHAFESLGATPEQLAPDSRSEDVKALDAQFPPAKPSDYVIHYGGAPMTPELKQFDQSARTWLAGAEFDRSLGNSLVSAIEKVSRQTQHMTAEQIESYALVEFQKLERIYGSKLDEKLRVAGKMVQELEKIRPGVNALLKSNGIGDSALVANLLIQQSERYWARRKK